MINPIYKFELSAGGVTRRAYPVYGEGLSKEWTQESGERFFRSALSGELRFTGADYDFIMQQTFGTLFALVVWYSDDAGASWSSYWTGQFTLADCSVDLDDAAVSVTPSPTDAYDAVLNGLEKEFDVIKLLPDMAEVVADKRPMLQVYRAGESVIGCYLGKLWWEQECEKINDAEDLEDLYHFTEIADLTYVDVSSASSSQPTLDTAIKGNNDGEINYEISSGGYTFKQQATGAGTMVSVELFVYPTGSPSSGWKTTQSYQSSDFPGRVTGQFTLFGYGGTTGGVVIDIRNAQVFARVLTDSKTYGSANTSPLLAGDMAGAASAYKYAVGYGDSSIILFSTTKTSTPTEWGLFRDEQYYAYPVSAVYGAGAFPMARNNWDTASLWFVEPVIDLDTYGVTQYSIKNAYPVASVISKILAQIAPTLTYAADILHSQFFYDNSTDPSFTYRLFMTPKSNALGAGYDIPAMKGPVTLRQILDMLRDCFRCYWYIDGTSFKIEHVKFFDNGRSYLSQAGVGADLTALTVRRTGKAWAEGTNKYKFEKQTLPERYEFGWMDDVSVPFNGYPMQLVSNYVEKGRVEKIQNTVFTSDVDYMTANPGGCSKDGFALLCGTAQGDGTYRVPYFSYTTNDIQYSLQNGPLSFAYLQRYYRYDMPALNYTINGSAVVAYGLKKPKVQEVVFPTHNDPDPLLLVKTGLGNGVVSKLSVNLSSRKAQATLNYAAE